MIFKTNHEWNSEENRVDQKKNRRASDGEANVHETVFDDGVSDCKNIRRRKNNCKWKYRNRNYFSKSKTSSKWNSTNNAIENR